jgi:hypothetical protein
MGMLRKIRRQAVVAIKARKYGNRNLPTITDVTPASAAALGGTAMTVTGTNFFSGGASSGVQSVKWVNSSTGAKTDQTGLNVTDVQITFSSVALTAGTYNIEVTTSRGVVTSTQIVTVA